MRAVARLFPSNSAEEEADAVSLVYGIETKTAINVSVNYVFRFSGPCDATYCPPCLRGIGVCFICQSPDHMYFIL